MDGETIKDGQVCIGEDVRARSGELPTQVKECDLRIKGFGEDGRQTTGCARSIRNGSTATSVCDRAGG